MKDNLKELDKKLDEKAKEFYSLRDKVNILKVKQKLPKLRKQYEGKYFKYNNSSGEDHHWPVYSYCEKVINDTEAKARLFETTPYESKFTFKDQFFFIFQTEITKAEYESALKRFKALVNKL